MLSNVGIIAGVVLGVFNTYRGCPERVVALRVDVPTEPQVFIHRPDTGDWGAAPVLNVSNEGSAVASGIALEYQHWPQSWTGIVTRPQFDLAHGEQKQIRLWSDTVANPDSALSRGTHLYFAVRLKFRNMSTNRPGCDLRYLDIHRAWHQCRRCSALR
jgi:hypothetical protein